MPRREDHEVHKDMWWHWIKKSITIILDNSLVYRVMIPDAAYIQLDLLKMSSILLETCRGF
jgi:hypothetical protein